MRMLERFGHDCLYGFFHAAVETEAFGGSVVFREDGPPNAGPSILRCPDDIKRLVVPVIEESASLCRVLEAERLMKSEVGDRVPIVGVVMSPFSLPVMQMGFEGYLDLLYSDPSLWERLMEVNEAFCVAWSNAQLAAGASIICYFDPVSSPTIIPKEKYLQTGYRVAKRTLPLIRGPVATHLASGLSLPICDALADTGTVAFGAGAQESLSQLKSTSRRRMTVVGNLNGIAMRSWNEQDVNRVVKAAIAGAAQGGGFILSDNHGEIPWQVPEAVLTMISDAVKRWGQYPLSWISSDGE
jgi:uroporphyrinogen decarboxylase